MESNEDVDLMLMRDGEKILVENAFVVAGMEATIRRRLAATIAAPAAAVFADDIMIAGCVSCITLMAPLSACDLRSE